MDEQVDYLDPETSEKSYEHGRTATIFLVDASAPMFTKIDEESDYCPFEQALKCAHKNHCTKIFTSEHDSIAVVLFGTNKTAPKTAGNGNDGVYANTFVLQELQEPCRAAIQLLENIIDKPHVIAEFRNDATDPPSLALADALWLCSSIFKKQKGKQDDKQIFLFTSNDNPYSNLSDEFKKTESRVRDLHDEGITLSLLPIGKEFMVNKFYKELLMNDADASPSITIDELLTETRKSYKKRCHAKLVFSLGPQVQFGVELYNPIRNATGPKQIKMDKRTSEPIKSITTKFNAVSSA